MSSLNSYSKLVYSEAGFFSLQSLVGIKLGAILVIVYDRKKLIWQHTYFIGLIQVMPIGTQPTYVSRTILRQYK